MWAALAISRYVVPGTTDLCSIRWSDSTQCRSADSVFSNTAPESDRLISAPSSGCSAVVPKPFTWVRSGRAQWRVRANGYVGSGTLRRVSRAWYRVKSTRAPRT